MEAPQKPGAELDQDALYQIYAAKDDEWHRKMTKQLLRKVDLHLLPFLVIMYLLNFLDRKYVHSKKTARMINHVTSSRPRSNCWLVHLIGGYANDRSNLSQARLGSLEEDLDMHNTDYNLATSILFVGYLLMQLPSNLLITRIRPSLFLGVAMGIWGLISACQASSQSFAGLVVARFFLGFVEAPFFPGAIMLM